MEMTVVDLDSDLMDLSCYIIESPLPDPTISVWFQPITIGMKLISTKSLKGIPGILAEDL